MAGGKEKNISDLVSSEFPLEPVRSDHMTFIPRKLDHIAHYIWKTVGNNTSLRADRPYGGHLGN